MKRSLIWNDRGLFALRFALGLVFIMHGWQKWFEYGLGGVSGSMASLGLPLPGLSALLISTTELVGGLALLAGIGTRIAAGLLAFAMSVAVVTVHLPNGFFAPAGIEFPLTLLIASVAIALTGPGRYSVSEALRRSPAARHDEQHWSAAA